MNRVSRGWSLVSALALTLVAYAADTVKLDIKPGLWEMSVDGGKMSGQLPIPEEMMQKLPPEQSEKLMAAMQAAATKPISHKTCVTAENMNRSLITHEVQEGCTQQILSNQASELSMTGTCARDGGTQTYQIRVQRVSREEYQGSFSFAITRGTQTMNVERTIKGKWLAASCGDVK
jgi:hypothetical protein